MTYKQIRKQQQQFIDEEARFLATKKKVDASVNKLKEAGNIQETAAVFTHEGMEIFMKMMTNSIEALVHEAVERKMQQTMTGLFEGLAAGYLNSIRPAGMEEARPDSVEAFRAITPIQPAEPIHDEPNVPNDNVSNRPIEEPIKEPVVNRKVEFEKRFQEMRGPKTQPDEQPKVEMKPITQNIQRKSFEERYKWKDEAPKEEVAPVAKKRIVRDSWKNEEEEQLLAILHEHHAQGLTKVSALRKFSELSGRTVKAVNNRVDVYLKERAPHFPLKGNPNAGAKSTWTDEDDELLWLEVNDAVANGKTALSAILYFGEQTGRKEANVRNRYYLIKNRKEANK